MLLSSWLYSLVIRSNQVLHRTLTRRSRVRPRRSPWRDSSPVMIMQLESRIMLDAAPYVIQLASSGTMEGSGRDYNNPELNSSGNKTIAVQIDRTIQVVPGQTYDYEETFNEKMERSGPGSEHTPSASSVYHDIRGSLYHSDVTGFGSIGQPEEASLSMYSQSSPRAGTTGYSTTEGPPPRLLGDSNGAQSNVTTGRIRIRASAH